MTSETSIQEFNSEGDNGNSFYSSKMMHICAEIAVFGGFAWWTNKRLGELQSQLNLVAERINKLEDVMKNHAQVLSNQQRIINNFMSRGVGYYPQPPQHPQPPQPPQHPQPPMQYYPHTAFAPQTPQTTSVSQIQKQSQKVELSDSDEDDEGAWSEKELDSLLSDELSEIQEYREKSDNERGQSKRYKRKGRVNTSETVPEELIIPYDESLESPPQSILKRNHIKRDSKKKKHVTFLE